MVRNQTGNSSNNIAKNAPDKQSRLSSIEKKIKPMRWNFIDQFFWVIIFKGKKSKKLKDATKSLSLQCSSFSKLFNKACFSEVTFCYVNAWSKYAKQLLVNSELHIVYKIVTWIWTNIKVNFQSLVVRGLAKVEIYRFLFPAWHQKNTC